MKWTVLVCALICLVPFADFIHRHPRYVPAVWVVMGLLPFAQSAVPFFDIALISWNLWPGYVKGLEISALDLFAIAAWLTLPRTTRRLPFRLPMALYLAAVLLSAFQAQVPEAALFYAWQLLRMFFVYLVVARACADERNVRALLAGMAAGICIQAIVVVWQKFGLGIGQPSGTFGHQNTLGMVAHFITIPCFALLLARDRSWPSYLAPVSGWIVAALSGSRAALGLAALGAGLLLVVSTARRLTSWKAKVGTVLAIVAVASLPVFASLQTRTVAEYASSNLDRAAHDAAAAAIVADHPLGIGANNYSLFSISQAYTQRAGVLSGAIEISSHVHDVYRVTAAELGWQGLFAFSLLLLWPVATAADCAWREREQPRGEIALGLGAALCTVYLHAFYEWIFLTAQVQYLFAMCMGMVAGLAGQLGHPQKVRPNRLFSNEKGQPSWTTLNSV